MSDLNTDYTVELIEPLWKIATEFKRLNDFLIETTEGVEKKKEEPPEKGSSLRVINTLSNS